MNTHNTEIHAHCVDCHRRKCKYKGSEASCPVVSCGLKCGAVFHSCKTSEHAVLCPLTKVPCLNASSGCPAELLRNELTKHLPVCPASIVCCTMEWCRWPVYSHERQQRVVVRLNNLRARSGQLDVALALRDQRVLMEARSFRPRSILRTLRNKSTQQHPAVPIFVGGCPLFDNSDSQNDGCAASSCDSEDDNCDDAPWITAKKPPGLAKSICHKLFGTPPPRDGCCTYLQGNTNEMDVKCSLCNKKVDDGISVENSQEDSRCCMDGLMLNDTVGLINANEPTSASTTTNCCDLFSETNGAEDIVSVAVVDCKAKSSDPGSECLNLPLSLTDQNSIGVDSFTKRFNCTSNSAVTYTTSVNNQNVDSDVLPVIVAVDNGMVFDQTGNTVGNGQVNSAPAPPENAVPVALNEVLAVDLNIENYARNTVRPRSMYTFMCGQMFRRDAFSRHAEDVHSAIHSGLCDWLEHRCPLAHYGCTFSIPQLRPKHGRVIFSSQLDSFGLKPVAEANCCLVSENDTEVTCDDTVSVNLHDCDSVLSRSIKELTPELLTSKNFDSAVVIADRYPSPANYGYVPLTTLPVELLLHIARFLDSFSLCSLSLTCWYLRSVCRQLVVSRGMVVQQWKRKTADDGRIMWNVAQHLWMFSTAFDKIKEWEWVEQSDMYHHIANCPFNDRCELPSVPVRLPDVSLKESKNCRSNRYY